MYKIGTGEKGTVPGKVYLYAKGDKDLAGTWVYCKGKLYLRKNNDSPCMIRVLCPVTFKELMKVKLSSGEAFREPSALKFNRNMPLLSDGEKLYTISLSFKNVKRKIKEGKQEAFDLLKKAEGEHKQEEAKKGKSLQRKSKSEVKKENKIQDTVKVCEFFLTEYDIAGTHTESDEVTNPADEALINELFISFSNYFTKKECAYAMWYNKNDMEKAARWLIMEGENERGVSIVPGKNSVLLAQSQIQDGQEYEVIENSILTPNHLVNNLWTMNKGQVTLHSIYPYARVFSIKPEDTRTLNGIDLRVDALGKKVALKKKKQVSDSDSDEDAVPEKILSKHINPPNEEEEENAERELLEERKRQEQLLMAANIEKAAKFFEDVEVKGTYLASVPSDATLIDRSTLTYDESTHKFFILVLDSSSVCVTLEYGDMPALNISSMPSQLLEAYNKRNEFAPTFKGLAERLLFFLKDCENYRYRLPWRWDNWDTLYSQMYDVILQNINNNKGNPNDPSQKIPANKIARLKQHAEKHKEQAETEWISKYNFKSAPPQQVVKKKRDRTQPRYDGPRRGMLSEFFGRRPSDSLRPRGRGRFEDNFRPPPRSNFRSSFVNKKNLFIRRMNQEKNIFQTKY